MSLSVKDQLLRLVRIQDIVQRTLEAQRVVEDAPRKIEEIEARFRERNAEYVAVRERHDALEADRTSRSGQLELLDEQRGKYMEDLMQVQNQREYAAMLKEIDNVKSQIAENEDAVLRDMEELEAVRTELASHESHIQEERKLVADQRGAVEKESAEAQERIARLEEQRQRVQADLPAPLVATVGRLEVGRQGVFLAAADDGVCLSCYVRVRPQVFQEIKAASRIHTCGNCRRLLYHESLRAELSGPGGTGTASPDKIQTIDGRAL